MAPGERSWERTAIRNAGMEALGYGNGKWSPDVGIRPLIARAVCDLDSYPAGIPRRAAGLLTWLQVRRCFPAMADYASAALSRCGLLTDAERFEGAISAVPDWNRDRAGAARLLCVRDWNTSCGCLGSPQGGPLAVAAWRCAEVHRIIRLEAFKRESTVDAIARPFA
jgi:hypothetical protein